MTVNTTTGEYEKASVETIRTSVLDAFEAEFGDIDRTAGSVWYSVADSVARTEVDFVQDDIQDVFQSAFLRTATSDNLDKLVELVGVERRAAQEARGYARFTSTTVPVTSDVDIGAGEPVSTGGNNPVSFKTTKDVAQGASIALYDNFEGGSLSGYKADTGSFNVQSSTALSGTYSLKSTTNEATVVSTSLEPQVRGDKYHIEAQLGGSGAVHGTLFLATDKDNGYRVLLDDANNEVALELLDTSANSNVQDIKTNSYDFSGNSKTGTKLDLIIDVDVQGDITVAVEDSGTELVSFTATDSTYYTGRHGFYSGDSTAKYWDNYSSSKTAVEIEASQAGTIGNVDVDTIDTLPSGLSGIDSLTNPVGVGDTDFVLPDGTNQISGRAEESDDSLRQRVRETLTQGGSATLNAVLGATLPLDDVRDVTIVANKQASSGTTSPKNFSGTDIPAHSFEPVVLGGDGREIADEIAETKAVTDRDVGGKNGTGKSFDYEYINGQTETIEFTRPSELDIDMSLDLRVTSDYPGNDDIRDDIVDYIGGTNSDGGSVSGTGLDEPIYLDKIFDVVVGNENGVLGINRESSTIQGGDFDDGNSAVTEVNDIEAVDVAATEVAVTDATDGSISITTTEV